MASAAWCLPVECQSRGHELPVCERPAVHDCWNAGGTKSCTGGSNPCLLQLKSAYGLSDQMPVPGFSRSFRAGEVPTIAYLANQFPSQVEPYVPAEIQELRSRGFRVIPSSARFSTTPFDAGQKSFISETMYLQPLRPWLLVRAACLCLQKSRLMKDLFTRILIGGKEGPGRRVRALLHTWLGAYYALLLKGRGVEHIHVHHGYFASWIALVAARLLRVSFSITLHGSDLLLHRAYLDTKLDNCSFCVTVSEFNRQHILEHFPSIRPEKITVQHLGIASVALDSNKSATRFPASFVMLAVGRLHPVK
ncbi:MAG: hypothetical protein DME65_14900, partial [Verrucomicrobia bacterium]